MWFRYNPQIIFYHFFCKLNLVIFQALLLSTYVNSMYLVRVTPLMNFTFSHGLKICMWFRYNPQIIFYHFFCKLNLVIFQALLLSTYVNSMYLVRVTPLMNFTFSDDSLFLKKKILAGDINSLNLLVVHIFSQDRNICETIAIPLKVYTGKRLFTYAYLCTMFISCVGI